ncbi:MAG: hypothetical protein JSR54_01330 [Proteobacteria bacterium]|nr:hypothetical protein [Pseudomonadota bacterium]
MEDGRERYRLHIGYFSTVAEAERLLPVVRAAYPAAFVSPAPQSNLGSLDDTAVARFSIIKPIEAAAPESSPASVPAPSRPAPPAVASEPPRLRPAGVAAESLPGVTTLRTAISAPVAAAPVAPTPAAPAPEAPAPEEKPAQRYAVQLEMSKSVIDLAKIPSLAIFSGYLLYAVETEAGGRRMFGVRLGFYGDALSARLVAQYVRSDFKGVTVVPVSEREVSRASGAAIRLSPSRDSRSTGTRQRWPAAAVSVAFVPAAASS